MARNTRGASWIIGKTMRAGWRHVETQTGTQRHAERRTQRNTRTAQEDLITTVLYSNGRCGRDYMGLQRPAVGAHGWGLQRKHAAAFHTGIHSFSSVSSVILFPLA